MIKMRADWAACWLSAISRQQAREPSDDSWQPIADSLLVNDVVLGEMEDGGDLGLPVARRAGLARMLVGGDRGAEDLRHFRLGEAAAPDQEGEDLGRQR